MKAALLTGIGTFKIQEIPAPEIQKETDVLIRIQRVGVCGSDMHYFHDGCIGDQIIQYPFIVGHEAAGIVHQTGSHVTRVQPDQRIAIDPAVFCGICDQCQTGRENTCRNLLFLGCPGQLSGALCEFLVLPESCCYPIPDQMTFDQAVLAEPLAIAVYSVEQSKLRENATVAILGAGPVGLSMFHSLHLKNIQRVYITDKISARLKVADSLNPEWSGNPDELDCVKEILEREPLGIDTVFECSGDKAAIRDAILLLKPGGTLVLIGIPESDTIEFPVHLMRRKEIQVINIRRQAGCTQKVIELLESGQINMDSLVTHHFDLDQVQEAFKLVDSYGDGVMKAMIGI